MRIAIHALLVCTLFSLPALGQDGDPKEFDKGLHAVENLIRRGQWKNAQRRLDKALGEHEGQLYVKVRLPELERIARRIAYRIAYPAKDPQSLISGKLVSWNPKTGKIKLRYTNDRDSMDDFIRRKSVRHHPLVFKGPFTVTVKGRRYGQGVKSGPAIVLAQGRRAFRVGFGTSPNKQHAFDAQWYPSHLIYYEGDDEKKIDEKRIPPVPTGKKFKLKLVVKDNMITASCNGKKVVSGRKPRDFWGTVGFILGSTWTDIELAGFAESAWLEGLRDKEEQEQRTAFEKTFRPQDHLPRWLYEKTPATSPSKAPKWPGKPDKNALRRIEDVAMWVEGDEPERAATILNRIPPEDIPAAARALLKARILLLENRRSEALVAVQRCTQADPAFVEARILEANLLSALGQWEQSRQAWDRLVESHPHHTEVARHRAIALLLDGRPEEAKAVVQEALIAGASRDVLEPTHRLIVQAEAGPAWPRRFEVKTRHYIIASDIDKDICYAAGRVLEKAHTAYNAYVRRSGKDDRKFRVFIFSGKDSYTAYAKDALGSSLPGSVGLYSKLLKQLLIMNVSQREEMYRTIRHEGFHQYMDRIASDSPIWFDEGLASYFETAGDGGSWKAGLVREDFLDLLKEQRLPTIESILTRSRDSFYRRKVRSYAESWALIHFLYHGGGGGKRLLSRLFDGLGTGPADKLFDEVFSSVDREDMESRFRAYLESLMEG